MTLLSLAISIPAYNEEQTLDSVVRAGLAILQRHTTNFEIVIIDDGSTDGTGSIADGLAQEIPQVRVVHHPQNMGFGPTLRDVFALPEKDWVFFIPADGQIPPKELEKMLPFCENTDLIVGWRARRRDPFFRRLAASLYNGLISVMLRRRIHDVDSVVLFRRAITKGWELKSRSAFIHAEFCLEAARRGASLMEVPIDHRHRAAGRAKGIGIKLIFETFSELVGYIFRRRGIRV